MTRNGQARVDALDECADHLSEALGELERADYNVPEERELQRLLEARDTVEERREDQEGDDGE